MLLAHPDRETPRVRHLLLDLRFMSTATPLNSEGGGREQPQPGERGYMEELLDTLMDDRKISFWNSMISLLDILSPHLVTLAIVFTPCVANVGLPLPLPNKTFPLLSELTVCTAPYVPDPIHAQFPALKYLHLSYCITYFEVFRDKIPALSHLRITGHTIAMSPPGHKHSTLPIDLELMPQFERLAICPDDPNFEQRKLPEFPQEIRDVTDILQPAVSTGIHDSIYVEIEKDWTRGVEGRRGSYW
ncbi:hypothetical protein NLI96_g10849 [Meripilus lineatus]|uniref:Uncharacterized protein n=1 Tax=Meripilus lineatus TaxID=2056292 RepID=A0AAD5USU6_9APHY|nr:hypothetical protein NLI96_g10849 [Physisporinus lineatus]